jgi:spore coat protein U-like protein
VTLPRLTLVVAMLLGTASRVDAACTVSTTGLNFGPYNVFAATPVVSTGTITFRCQSSDRDIQITISTGSSGTFAPRTLKRGAEPLTYNLYLDSGMTSTWGDGTGATSIYTRRNPPNNQSVDVTVYAQIFAAQDVSMGTYTDSLVVIINF